MNLKYLSVFILLIFNGIFLSAQTIDEIGLIPISISEKLPSELTSNQYERIKKAVARELTKKGCTSYSGARFECCPTITLEEEERAEGGMKDIIRIRGTVDIMVIDTMTGNIFKTFSDSFKGYSTSKEKAVSMALGECGLNTFSEGLDELKEKIIEWYRINKLTIFREAESLAASGEYDSAIAHVLSFPECIQPDYNEAIDLADNFYTRKMEAERLRLLEEQTFRNNQLLVKASNKLAASDPLGALNILMDFEMGIENLDQEYVKLRTEAQSRISNEEKIEYERQERAYRDSRRDIDRDYQLKSKEISAGIENKNQKLQTIKEIALAVIRNKK